MSDGMIVTIGGFLLMLIAVIKPIISLNTNITELKASIDQFKDAVNDLKTRITEHGKELDSIREKLADHEARLKALEK